jgi:hypothetical protein
MHRAQRSLTCGKSDPSLSFDFFKSFLGKRADWSDKALSYSGQLAAYRTARHNPAIDSTWIHFAAGGGLVQIE